MKIIITGKNSYIGTAFERYMSGKGSELLTVDTLGDWKDENFKNADAVFHVAGLAHANPKEDMRDEYYRVNCDLAFDVAKYAMESGVRQFVFMSSIIVYGNQTGAITKDTKPDPVSFYGDSKLRAEERLMTLNSDSFKVTIIRSPMIYGPGCRGNYPRLSALAKRIPFFMNVGNKRSMLYIENLCECVRQALERKTSGILYPQNAEYVNTAELFCKIREHYGKKTYYINIFNPVIRLFARRITTFNKLFGDLYYEKSLSGDFSYCVTDFPDSIYKTEVQK